MKKIKRINGIEMVSKQEQKNIFGGVGPQGVIRCWGVIQDTSGPGLVIRTVPYLCMGSIGETCNPFPAVLECVPG
jgi:hypothetical protein